jgi:hypothetical protein
LDKDIIMKKIIAIIFTLLFFAFAKPALAHCPLCTAGAGLAAVAASWLGVSTAPIGVFIGAFAVALGLWISRIIKKDYIPKQMIVLVVFSFLTTVLPLIPLMPGYSSIYISIGGDYGSFLNRTYLINLFLAGAILGGVLLFVAPMISKKITAWRNDRMFSYQGLIITFSLLAVMAAILEFLL